MATGTAGTSARDYHTKQIHYLRGTLGFGTGSSATVTLGVIPASSAVIEAWCIVTTAYNAGSTNAISVGTAASAAAYATFASAIPASAGRKVGTILVSAAGATVMPTADTSVTATFTGTGTAATAGSAEIVLEYAVL